MAFVADKINVRDLDSLAEAAPKLRQLSNNSNLIVERINKELEDWKSFQSDNTYTSQTVMLATEREFYVRANLWLPPAKLPQDREWQDELFYYRVPHDHNFSFLTVGHYGSGYETTIWEYDRKGIRGEPGEDVELKLLERTSLPLGKVMLYRACQDVHSQEHPEECSISINLIASPPEILKINQYLFDTEAGKITSNVQKSVAGHIFLCTMAQHIGNGATASVLEKVSQTHFSPKVRVAAATALAEIEPVAALTDVWRSVLPDKDKSVRRAATDVLEGGGDAGSSMRKTQLPSAGNRAEN
ncbi:MAG TPA: HEAT repeat domain-containing protein [Candidatus Angelobacter sp.]|nr:HEAT repeat domain-containing protein [Candidatus Angelobacter sp.]